MHRNSSVNPTHPDKRRLQTQQQQQQKQPGARKVEDKEKTKQLREEEDAFYKQMDRLNQEMTAQKTAWMRWRARCRWDIAISRG